MTPRSDRLIDVFADAGTMCAGDGLLPDAFDELTDRLAIQGLWCVGEVDGLGVCRTCGTIIRNGHSPEPGCALAVPLFVARLPRLAWRQFRFFVLRRGRG